MSPRAWGTCPACEKEARETKETEKKELAKQYGKIPPEEYIQRRTEVDKPIEVEETLRENYELGVDMDFKFTAYYRCHCENCGFEFKFEHEQEVKGS